jgi:hypothetical protein
VALYALVSYAIVAAVTFKLQHASRALLMFLGGTSFGLYYWWIAPTLGGAYGAPSAGAVVVRVLAALLLAIWFARGFDAFGRRARTSTRLADT